MLQYGQKSRQAGEVPTDTGLFEEVTRLNGPLPDYHPQMILQCLLWGTWTIFTSKALTDSFSGKVNLVKDVIERLHVLLQTRNNNSEAVAWTPVDFASFLEQAQDVKSVSAVFVRCTTWVNYDLVERTSWKGWYSSLLVALQPIAGRCRRVSRPLQRFSLHLTQSPSREDPNKFSPRLVNTVIEELHDNPLSDLTPLEHEHLIVLIQTRLEVSPNCSIYTSANEIPRSKNNEERSMVMDSAI